MNEFPEYIGLKRGRLTITKAYGKRNKPAMFDCVCECGQIRNNIAKSQLVRNKIKNCGKSRCLIPMKHKPHKPHKFKDLSGMKVTHLLVVKRVDNINKRVAYEALCDCGTIKIFLADDLRREKVKSCGCLLRKSRREQRDMDIYAGHENYLKMSSKF